MGNLQALVYYIVVIYILHVYNMYNVYVYYIITGNTWSSNTPGNHNVQS